MKIFSVDWFSRIFQETRKVAILKEVQANGVVGGNSVSGVWITRNINTLIDPYNIGITLNANQFTLPKGKYILEGDFAVYALSYNMVRLFNVTQNVVTDTSMTGFTPILSSSSDRSDVAPRLVSYVEVSQTTTFRIEHIAINGQSGGFGAATSSDTNNTSNETFLILKIEKIG